MSLLIPDWHSVLVFLLTDDSRELVQIPSPALAYSKWELRGLLGIPRTFRVVLQPRPDEYLELDTSELYPFRFVNQMRFRCFS